MRKKLKILLSLSLLIFCLIPLTGCQISINIDNSDNNDNINNDNLINSVNIVHFETVGVYLKIAGNVQAGNQNELIYLTEEDRPEDEKDNLNLSYNFLDYSYEENLDGTPNGSVSMNIPDWKIGVLKFTEEIQVFQIEMIFTNYTEFPIEIQVKVTGNGLYDNNILNLDTNQSNIYNYTLTKNMLNKDEIDGVSFSVKAYEAYSKNFTT